MYNVYCGILERWNIEYIMKRMEKNVNILKYKNENQIDLVIFILQFFIN